jgi:hypothetical protein
MVARVTSTVCSPAPAALSVNRVPQYYINTQANISIDRANSNEILLLRDASNCSSYVC